MREKVLWMPTAQAWLPLAGFVLTLGLAIFVIRRRPRSPVHRAFAALNVAAALWNLDVFLLFTLQDRGMAGALDRYSRYRSSPSPGSGFCSYSSSWAGKPPTPSLSSSASGRWSSGV